MLPSIVNSEEPGSIKRLTVEGSPRESTACRRSAVRRGAVMRQSIATSVAVVAACMAMCLTSTLLQAQEMEVKIGHVAPTSGGIAHLGRDSELGVRLAIDELNARGVTIAGRKAKLVLLAEDDAGDPKQATAAASKLVDAKVSGVIGHVNSLTSIAASKIYSDAGIPQITPAATSPALTRQGLKTVFRIVPTDNEILAAAVAFAGKKTGGRTLILRSPFDRERIGRLQTKVERVRPETLVYDGPINEAMSLARSDLKTIITTDCGASYQSVQARVYCASVEPNYGGSSSPLREFHDKFRSKFNIQPFFIAPYTYDAVKVMVTAMVKAGSADPSKYLPVLAKTANFPGVTGSITFNARGDLANPRVNVFELRYGRFEFDSLIEASSGSDGICSDSCEFCCSDKDGKFCAKDEKCRR